MLKKFDKKTEKDKVAAEDTTEYTWESYWTYATKSYQDSDEEFSEAED